MNTGKKIPNLLFAHGAWPTQYYELANYLDDNSIAKVYRVTSDNARKAWQFVPNIRQPNFTYEIDATGKVEGHNDYYFAPVDRCRKARGFQKTVAEILKGWDIQLILCHYAGSPPLFLFDEIKIPIGVYIEFPCFRMHGHHADYPPLEVQKFADKHTEMMSTYCAFKSDFVITPTEYAKSMLPKELHYKIFPIFEGFNSKKIAYLNPNFTLSFEKKPNETIIGFTGRNLCSAKGFDRFMDITTELLKMRTDLQFVIIGDPDGGYGHERHYLKNHKTFKDYLLYKHKPNLDRYHFLGHLNYNNYSACIKQIDLFLYPLLNGAGNWGLVELLLRGCNIVASDRCYIPEVITNDVNGILVDYEDTEKWVREINNLIDNKEKRARLSNNAQEMSKRFHIENVAPKYMEVFQEAINKYA